MAELTATGRKVRNIFGVILLAAVLYFSVRAFAPDFTDQVLSRVASFFPGAEAKHAQLANLSGQLPGSFAVTTNAGIPEKLPLPTSRLSRIQGKEIRLGTYFWSANMGLHYAIGGALVSAEPDGTKIFGTSQGSIMENYGVVMRWKRIDDIGPMVEQTMALARAYKQNPNTKAGIHGFTIMGDGAAVALTGPNELLEKELGPDYIIQAKAHIGASNGEDGMWGPPEWMSNPQLALGSVIAVVSTGDVGDFNVVAMWCDINKLPINLDQTTYDGGAVNILNTASYLDTGVKFASRTPAVYHYTIVNGQRIKRTTTHAIDAYCSWTPVDFDVAKVRQDVVRIYSTHDNMNQMPCTLFLVKKWADDNRQLVVNMISAISEAGRQIKHYDDALDAACDISARIYGELPEKDGAWIKRFYKGDFHRDTMGRTVYVKGKPMELGGSRVFDLADMMYFMGLLPGQERTKKYQEVYETFGDLYLRLNPEFLPNGYYPASRVIDPSFVSEVADRFKNQFGSQTAAMTPTLPGVGEEATKDVLGHADYTIEFAVGSAQLAAAGIRELESLYRQASAGNAALEVHGHTDESGDSGANLVLSKERGNSVKTWLMNRSPLDFPDRRIKVIPHGEDDPLDRSGTPAAYARNRRVEIYQLRVNQ